MFEIKNSSVWDEKKSKKVLIFEKKSLIYKHTNNKDKKYIP